LPRQPKGILKTSTSLSKNSKSTPDLNVLEKLHDLLKTNHDFTPSIVKNLLVSTTSEVEKILPVKLKKIHSQLLNLNQKNFFLLKMKLSISDDLAKKEDRSDSGRESEDQYSLERSFSKLYPLSSSSSSSGIITDSPNR